MSNTFVATTAKTTVVCCGPGVELTKFDTPLAGGPPLPGLLLLEVEPSAGGFESVGTAAADPSDGVVSLVTAAARDVEVDELLVVVAPRIVVVLVPDCDAAVGTVGGLVVGDTIGGDVVAGTVVAGAASRVKIFDV